MGGVVPEPPPHPVATVTPITSRRANIDSQRRRLGTHHKVDKKHLNRYVAEFTYRLNRRTTETTLLARRLSAWLEIQTITYRQLIAKPELSG